MGTPDFAVPALQALHDHQYPVLQVVTQPDRPKGRGRRLIAPPVKIKAEALGYPVLQPHNVKSDDVYGTLSELHPDLFVVVAFGHILTQRMLSLPAIGAVNIHASLLPKYRGPAPIQRAIIAGETHTGVTTMMMDSGLDTGDILLAESLAIRRQDTSASLHDRLSDLGAGLLIRTLKAVEAGTLSRVPQDHTQASYAPLLTKAEGRINWNQPAEALARFIRGMNPWPGAFFFSGDKRIKVYTATALPDQPDDAPGTVIKGYPDELRVAASDGTLSILELQSESGKRLAVKDFLHGFQPIPGTRFD